MVSPALNTLPDRRKTILRCSAIRLLAVFAMIIFILLIPHRAGAHATLIRATPAANAELPQSPPRILLEFNEQLEASAFYIKVFDANKKSVTNTQARINATHTAIELDLPALPKGHYVVTYHVISADGHPVEGTYLFAVGQSLDGPPTEPGANIQHSPAAGLSLGPDLMDMLNFALRIIYYVFLLVLSGWVIWLRFGQVSDSGTSAMLEGWRVQLLRAYVLVFLLLMFTHLYSMAGDGGAETLLALFTRTGIGYVWITTLVVSLLGFVLLGRSLLLDVLWVILLWLLKSLNGHAAAFEPTAQTITLDVIHLAAASLWMGGLLMLIVLCYRKGEVARKFFERFSPAAGAAMILLTVSGIFMVLIYLPDIRYVIETNWGKMLLVKSALVVLVIISGMLLRRSYRKRSADRPSALLMFDGVLALLIAAIVGIFTYLSPLPENQPLNWHAMGGTIHMTTQITPNAPGVNDFTVKAWLPEELGKPKQVVLKLHNLSMPEMAAIEVPLSYTEDMTSEESFGLKRHTYKARGAYMPYPGDWRIEVRIMDSNDDETPYERQIRVY
ncbi:copper resistance CopC/CopD family protein [Paenibacillus xerothermodurans]|nr:copper resistance protein CopC [Paenibacillus xerothermodurans]